MKAIHQIRAKVYRARARAWRLTVQQDLHPDVFDGTPETYKRQIKYAFDHSEEVRRNLKYAEEEEAR